MQTLSKEAENKVILAVKQAVTLVDEDEMSPVDAIEKIARDSSWGPDMVRFASYAYNTGRQTYQRQENDNALEKFADFPLADNRSHLAQAGQDGSRRGLRHRVKRVWQWPGVLP